MSDERSVRPEPTSRVAARLAAAGFELPSAPASRGRYAGARRDGELIHLAGHTDRGLADCVGQPPLEYDDDIEGAQRAAALAAVHLVAAAATVSRLDDIEAVVHLRGYVRSTPSFTRHPEVIDAASDLLVLAFEPMTPHTRAAIGVTSLPGAAPVEVEAILLARRS